QQGVQAGAAFARDQRAGGAAGDEPAGAARPDPLAGRAVPGQAPVAEPAPGAAEQGRVLSGKGPGGDVNAGPAPGGSPLWQYAEKREKESAAELKTLFGDNVLFSTPFDPKAIPSLAKYATAKIIKGGYTVAKLTADLVQKFGEAVRPHVEAVWAAAQAELASR